MIRVLIVDDEPPARRKVRRFLESDPEISDIQEAGSGAEAITALQTLELDLVYLDVQLPDIDGFAALACASEPRPFHVIFLTAHEQYAVQAFDAEALDYLLKPVDPQRFERALERAKEQIALRHKPTPAAARGSFVKRLLVQTKGREMFLPVEQLDWAASDRNYVHLHSGPNTYTIRSTLESVMGQLDPDQFVRISRSELINLDQVKEMQPFFHGERRVILKSGHELTWKRRFRAGTSRD